VVAKPATGARLVETVTRKLGELVIPYSKYVLPQLDFLQTWARKDVVLPPTPAASAQPDKTRIYFVDKPGAAQSEIRVGYTSPACPTMLSATTTILGQLRARRRLQLAHQPQPARNKVYTYGAGSGFRSTHYAGPFTAQAGVRADATAPAIKEFMSEIAGCRSGITPEELAFLQSSVGQSDALRYETGQRLAILSCN